MGCQMNEYDSDYLGQILQNSNYLPTTDPKKADLILINTCTVRAKAEQKAYSLLGRMTALKKRKPHLVVGLTGCLAQQKGASLLEAFPKLDLVLGPREIGGFQEILSKVVNRGERLAATDMDLEPVPPIKRPGYFVGHVKSYVSIMEGCNNFCTYCVVPYVRGKEVSRQPEELIEEVQHLVRQGVKEITLLGQNVNSYFCGGEKAFGFTDLLRALDEVEGLKRIRFTTSHPKDLSDELIHCFGGLEHLCPHIHLPLQAGSNRVLKAMRRGYTREKYLDLIQKLKALRPGIAVTSDMMVGFPGESDSDFKETLDMIRRIEFDNIYSFKYSDREGTLAAKMKGKIPESEKSSRLSALQTLQRAITLKKNRKLVGAIVEILVEGESKRGGQLTGRTGTNKVVNFISNYNSIGNLINVMIKCAYANSLWGERREG
jgi:tRNA-2-methylthio-N6-dimethylallyladenosine synthase